MPGAASATEDDGMLLISLEANEETIEENPIKREAELHAEQHRGHVNLMFTEAELKDKFSSRVVVASQMVGFLIDAQTSRVSVSNGYVDAVGRLINSLSLKKASVAVVCGQRMELVSTVIARLNGIKGMQTFVIQLTGMPSTKLASQIVKSDSQDNTIHLCHSGHLV